MARYFLQGNPEPNKNTKGGKGTTGPPRGQGEDGQEGGRDAQEDGLSHLLLGTPVYYNKGTLFFFGLAALYKGTLNPPPKKKGGKGTTGLAHGLHGKLSTRRPGQ